MISLIVRIYLLFNNTENDQMKLFGTKGIRDIVNKFLDCNYLSKMGMCIATVMNRIKIDYEEGWAI